MPVLSLIQSSEGFPAYSFPSILLYTLLCFSFIVLLRILFAIFSDKKEQSSSLFKIVLLSLLLYSVFVLSLCIVRSFLLLYPGKNPVQSLFNIVFLSQFLYTLFFFFILFLFFTVLCQILFAPLKFSPVLSLILSFCFFNCVSFLFFLSLYSVGLATCKSIFLSLLL